MAKFKEKSEELIQLVLETIVQRKGYKDIKANMTETFPDPAKITRNGTEDYFVPDVTAYKNGVKNYFEVAIKNSAATQEITSKWILLNRLASIKGGHLFIIAPKGHHRFANDLITQNNLSAKLIKL